MKAEGEFCKIAESRGIEKNTLGSPSEEAESGLNRRTFPTFSIKVPGKSDHWDFRIYMASEC